MDSKTVKPVRSYYRTGKREKVATWSDGSKHIFVRYLRKVSDIVNSVIKAKFSVEKIVEPLEIRKNDPWKAKFYPLKLVKIIGPAIIFKAKKN